MSVLIKQIQEETRQAAEELITISRLREGDIFVVGCSSSEVIGEKIGTHSSMEAAEAILNGILPLLTQRGIFLAAQCCEHLNRAIILEEDAVRRNHLTKVNAVPQIKAGGSFATAAYAAMQQPCAVERIQAQAGLDIGGVLIGMQLAEVAVPVRLRLKKIGEANLTAARTRPKFIGGIRAVYDESLL